jgi:DNA-binding transcriptional regulator PaaX
MGILEKEVKKEIRATKIQRAILQTISTAGLLSVALLAPKALQVLHNIGYNKILNKRAFDNSRKRLINAGLIRYSNEGVLSLTVKGKNKLEKFERLDFKFKIPKSWDGKWRVLAFDIKEKQRSVRDKVRITSNSIGFIKLQNSVWVFPYDCEDLITLLKADFGISREVLYMIVDKIENDKILKKHFKL